MVCGINQGRCFASPAGSSQAPAPARTAPRSSRLVSKHKGISGVWLLAFHMVQPHKSLCDFSAGGKTLHFPPNKLLLQTLLSLQNDAGSPAPFCMSVQRQMSGPKVRRPGDHTARGPGEQRWKRRGQPTGQLQDAVLFLEVGQGAQHPGPSAVQNRTH